MINIQSMIDQYRESKVDDQIKIREILQEAALLGLERHGFFEKAAFYGGTALRILYGLDRFSEDLDFTLLTPNPHFDFTPFLDSLRRELAAFGFQMDVSKKTKNIETSIVSAFMKMNTIEFYMVIGDENKTKLVNHNAKIQIKLEIDIDPPPQFRVENKLVTNPTNFYVLTLHKNDLFAGKMHAVLYRAWKGRIKGRDWYDLLWYIQKKIPLGIRFLESCMHQAGTLPLQERLSRDRILELLREKILMLNWKSAKEDLQAFITDPKKLDLWSSQFFLDAMEHLRFEE